MAIKIAQESRVRVQFRPTGSGFFPWAATVNGVWWVLRLNSFPDHPLYTFFKDGRRTFDLDDLPRRWLTEVNPQTAPLSSAEVSGALQPVESFVAYGSEVGQPCDNPFCCG